jgi:hypothetical protein
VQTSLAGVEYITRFGSPVTTYQVETWVKTTGKTLLLAAADTLALMEISVRDGTFTGRIKSLGDFEALSPGWWHTTMEIAAISEVSS